MSYEKKIRDLMARLASMSPEPPPYPEETHMAQHREPKRTSPALVFVGAALLVVALAVPLLLFTGDGEPEVVATTTTTTIASTSSTAAAVTSTTMGQASTTTTAPATTTTVPASTVWSGTVFMFQSPESSFLGNPAMVPVAVELTDLSGRLAPTAEFTDALAELGSEMPELAAGSGLTNSIPAGVRILERRAEGDVVIVDMNEAFLDGAGGLLADVTMLNQLVYTITSGGDEDAGVLFTVNGEPVTTFGSEGMDLSQPVDREAFVDELASIFLTEPLVASGGTYRVSGVANVFEAMLALQVIDGSGEVVHEEPVMASCGSGCWGDFIVDLDAGLITGGESSVRLLTHSAEDGSEIEVITVPVPAGDIWAITVGD